MNRKSGAPTDAAPTPRVTVGLPVYNGEAFIAETIDSVLHQTFGDFELIISDNASTDGTETICRRYAALDARIRYFRHDRNAGAAWNYNRCVELASGGYFKWIAADDLIAPEFLRRCVAVLDSDPDVAIAHTGVANIDGDGNPLGESRDLLDLRSPKPSRRYRQYLFRGIGGWNAVFGLIRLSILRETPLIGGYGSSDQVLLGELLLRGKVVKIPELLLTRRRHPNQSWRRYSRNGYAEWFDPANAHRRLPPYSLKLFLEALRSIARTPLPRGQVLNCYGSALAWGIRNTVLRPTRRKLDRLIRSADTTAVMR